MAAGEVGPAAGTKGEIKKLTAKIKSGADYLRACKALETEFGGRPAAPVTG